jgi:hypothetical protein
VTSRRTVALAGVGVALTLVLSGCVAPAFSLGSFEGKAGSAAQSMLSTVETALAAVSLSRAGKTFAPYVSEVLHYAEEDASSIQGSFDSIQPPGDAAETLRSRLDDLLSSAVSTLSELRIAARGGKLSALRQIAQPLNDLAQKLDRFAGQYPPSGGAG